jgi:hypothetical protein
MTQRNCRSRSTEAMRVMRKLGVEAGRSTAKITDPILEKLRQCPEAFKVGEILGKAFGSLKYSQEEVIDGDRLLPRPGTIIPPFA